MAIAQSVERATPGEEVGGSKESGGRYIVRLGNNIIDIVVRCGGVNARE